MAEAQDVDSLKRRGRRRLVGAVALVLAAVIVLPMVFDPEPRNSHPPVSVRIPGEDDGKFSPKPSAKPAESPKAEVKKPEEREKAKKPEVTEKARAEAALASTEYVVQVGAFANPEGVVAKLKGAQLPYYTEQSQGNLTRVRAGPFASKAAAEKALEQLKGLGLQPGAVTTKPG
jgi:DedD protein